MQRRKMIAGIVGVVAAAGWARASLAQGVVEKAGEKLDQVGRSIKRGATEVGDAVRKQFDGVRGEVTRMGIHNRVYSRLHWDVALNNSKFEVHMMKDGEVLLRGYVPDEAAHQRAVTLTRDTVGVVGVIDELVPMAKSTPAPAVPKAR
jgi:osmotically-inducible protein OsmY